MTSPAPYAAAALSALDGPLTHVANAYILDYPLDDTFLADLEILDGHVTFDSDWEPFVQASVTVRRDAVYRAGAGGGPYTFDVRPASFAGSHRLGLEIGYTYPSGITEVGDMLSLAITNITEDDAEGTVTITAQSDEANVQLSANANGGAVGGPHADVRDAINYLFSFAIGAAGGGYIDAMPAGVTIGGGSTLLTDYVVQIGDRWWPHVNALADAAGYKLWCDGYRTFRLTSATATETATTTDTLTLATGDVAPAAGVARIITGAGANGSLQGWADHVIVEHRWVNGAGATQIVVGNARATSVTIPRSVVKVDRPTAIDQAGADLEAAGILARAQLRGRKWRRTCGHSAYWLRPRRSVRTAINGTTQYEWITSVRFELDGSGTMVLETRELMP